MGIVINNNTDLVITKILPDATFDCIVEFETGKVCYTGGTNIFVIKNKYYTINVDKDVITIEELKQ